jgi:hypothetical protein
MTVFLKVKKIDLFQIVLYEFIEIKNALLTIRCAIKFNIDFINILCMYLRFFLLRSGLKCVSIFLFDSEQAIW